MRLAGATRPLASVKRSRWLKDTPMSTMRSEAQRTVEVIGIAIARMT